MGPFVESYFTQSIFIRFKKNERKEGIIIYNSASKFLIHCHKWPHKFATYPLATTRYADHKGCNTVDTHCTLRILLAQGAQTFCCLLNTVALESDIFPMKDVSCGLDDYVYMSTLIEAYNRSGKTLQLFKFLYFHVLSCALESI